MNKHVKIFIFIVGFLLMFSLATLGYFAFFRQVQAPRPPHPRFKVFTEIAKTQFQVGENISIRPSLVNIGGRPVTAFSNVRPLFIIRVYDEEKREVLFLPEVGLPIVHDFLLRPGVPYTEDYTFVLEQPGSYKIVARVEFSLNKDFAHPMRIYYTKPIWIEVVADFKPAEKPQFKVFTEIAKTQFQVGENISIRPSLVNIGRRTVTAFSNVLPLFIIRVYDAEKREVLFLPEVELPMVHNFLLSPGMPYTEDYAFALEQPGRYKIVAWIGFYLEDRAVSPEPIPMSIYAYPIWIEVVTD
jgi:hypothetical protein